MKKTGVFSSFLYKEKVGGEHHHHKALWSLTVHQ